MSESEPSGHALIQVDRNGQNSIIIHSGANREIREADARRVLAHFKSGDCLLLQNEISAIPEIMDQARQQGLIIFLNPAPMDKRVLGYPLDKVDYFIINEIEGRELTGAARTGSDHGSHAQTISPVDDDPDAGRRGVLCAYHRTKISVPAEKVTPVDTTAAGDTFIGYFIAQKIRGATVETCLRTATRAAAICVSRRGAADSIPRKEEVCGG